MFLYKQVQIFSIPNAHIPLREEIGKEMQIIHVSNSHNYVMEC